MEALNLYPGHFAKGNNVYICIYMNYIFMFTYIYYIYKREVGFEICCYHLPHGPSKTTENEHMTLFFNIISRE